MPLYTSSSCICDRFCSVFRCSLCFHLLLETNHAASLRLSVLIKGRNVPEFPLVNEVSVVMGVDFLCNFSGPVDVTVPVFLDSTYSKNGGNTKMNMIFHLWWSTSTASQYRYNFHQMYTRICWVSHAVKRSTLGYSSSFVILAKPWGHSFHLLVSLMLRDDSQSTWVFCVWWSPSKSEISHFPLQCCFVPCFFPHFH